MSGAEASYILGFFGALVAGFASIGVAETESKLPRIMLALGIICILPALIRLWIVAVAN